jgi:hypothetical protein
MTGKPIAVPGLECPLKHKDVSKVCHKCAWYTRITGMNPQTGEHMDKWDCAIAQLVFVGLDTAKATYESGAVTQELRNDMHGERVAQTRLLMRRVVEPPAAQLPNNNGQLLIAEDK